MIKLSCLVAVILLPFNLQGQNAHITQLEKNNIQLDSLDKSWLIENNSFLMDMSSLSKMDTTAMNRAIIEMSTKLLSNNLIDISEEEAKKKKDLITKIIHGALDYHGLEEEKMLSAMSWYNMIVREIKI